MIFLTVFLPFVIIFTILLRRSTKKSQDQNKAFWERELAANATRKKDIENLPYISFDPGSVPMHHELDDERAEEYMRELSSLAGKRILNCTGKSNTDLKLEYGAPNITKLTEYDGNYTVLVRSLARLAEKYILHATTMGLEDVSTDSDRTSAPTGGAADALRLRSDAKKLLEYSVSIGSDVRLCYELLSDIYIEDGDTASVEKLKTAAESLNSLSKEPILRMLERKTSPQE